MAPGASDFDVMALAAKEERILLTFDKDFGERVISAALPAACGIILMRIRMPKPGAAGQQTADTILARDD